MEQEKYTYMFARYFVIHILPITPFNKLDPCRPESQVNHARNLLLNILSSLSHLFRRYHLIGTYVSAN